MMRRWRALAIVPAAAMLMLAASPILAQEGTPDAGEADSPRLVAPEECTNQVAEPRPYDEVATILNLEGEGVPAPPTTQINAPLGEVADLDTTIAIEETARLVLACFNAGDFLRSAALMTDAGVTRAFWGLTIDQENRELARERLQAAPEPRAAEFLTRLMTVTDVSVLPDGRVAAFVVFNEPLLPPGGPETLHFVFAHQDGQWLVDDWIDFSIVPANFGAEASVSVARLNTSACGPLRGPVRKARRRPSGENRGETSGPGAVVSCRWEPLSTSMLQRS